MFLNVNLWNPKKRFQGLFDKLYDNLLLESCQTFLFRRKTMKTKSVHGITLFDLPTEAQERIFDHLDQESLSNLQNASDQFKETIISYVMNGRLGNRGMVSDKYLN